MCEFIIFVIFAIASSVTCSPKIQVYTTVYNETFKVTMENESFPYSSIDVRPNFGHFVFLIVGANDFRNITTSKTLQHEYHNLENKIVFNHGAHLVLIGCFDIGVHDLYRVDNFIKKSGGRKIRTFGYGIFNTNYTIKANLWDDHSVDLLLTEFMRNIHGNEYERHVNPNEFVTIFDPNLVGRFESFPMNTISGKFELNFAVTFILIGGDKMDAFRQNKDHQKFLIDIASNQFGESGLVFLMGCYNFRNHFYLIADAIEQQKARLVQKYKGPMKNDNIRVYVQGRGIWSSDFVFVNKSTKSIGKLIPNVDHPELDPFLDFYYEKISKDTEYRVYDRKLTFMQQLGFEYINGEYRSHAADDSFRFGPDYEVIKIIFMTESQFEDISADDEKSKKFKHILQESQPINHKIYLVVCYAKISLYPNVILSMLERHLGNFLKKNRGQVWLNAPKSMGPILRSGDGGQFTEWPHKPIDDILRKP